MGVSCVTVCVCEHAFDPGMCARAYPCVDVCARLSPVCARACRCVCTRALAPCVCVCPLYGCARACYLPVCARLLAPVCVRLPSPVCVCADLSRYVYVCGGGLLAPVYVCVSPLCVHAFVPNILFFESGLNTVHLITLKNLNVSFHIFMSSLQVIFMIQYIHIIYHTVCMLHRFFLY